MRTEWVGWLMVLVLFLGAEVFAQSGDLYVKPKRENVRQGPNGPKVAEVLGGTRVRVLEKQSNWVKVQLTGWIWQKSLTSDATMVDGFTVRASHILVGTEEEANQILRQLEQGVSFEELARRFSMDEASGMKGGDLGTFGRGDLRPEFEKAVFGLKVGQVSGVVKTDLGYHIVKRTE